LLFDRIVQDFEDSMAKKIDQPVDHISISGIGELFRSDLSFYHQSCPGYITIKGNYELMHSRSIWGLSYLIKTIKITNIVIFYQNLVALPANGNTIRGNIFTGYKVKFHRPQKRSEYLKDLTIVKRFINSAKRKNY